MFWKCVLYIQTKSLLSVGVEAHPLYVGVCHSLHTMNERRLESV